MKADDPSLKRWTRPPELVCGEDVPPPDPRRPGGDRPAHPRRGPGQGGDHGPVSRGAARPRANYRGVHRLNKDEQGRVKCVACMLCATACPAHCIDIVGATAPDSWPDREKYCESFVIDELRCIYCGMCEEACPVEAIELTGLYDLTGLSREQMIFDKTKLLSVFDLTKDAEPMKYNKPPARTSRTTEVDLQTEGGRRPVRAPTTLPDPQLTVDPSNRILAPERRTTETVDTLSRPRPHQPGRGDRPRGDRGLPPAPAHAHGRVKPKAGPPWSATVLGARHPVLRVLPGRSATSS